ncbi:MAG TPA: precorrin-3B C(17)-methyltransferase [Firmicutes bacterium]|jgi:precorrin-3B C17-methyltransferase|nr:precorrin-3B C(17)-methyltransferase [Bacillota bacterium]
MKIYVVGIGPGAIEDMTPRAIRALENSDYILGYKAYIELVRDLFPGKQLLSSVMTGEIERCELALEKALTGADVALISSGDSGIYGMAGIMLEVVQRAGKDVPVEIIPGITAASAAAAILGAPLMHDFAVISLSDLLTPWDKIVARIEAAAAADFVICLYNPKSKQRILQIIQAGEIIKRYRSGVTPTGIVRRAGRPGESYDLTTLEKMAEKVIDMFSIVIIGNSRTYINQGRMITPRGYFDEQ